MFQVHSCWLWQPLGRERKKGCQRTRTRDSTSALESRLLDSHIGEFPIFNPSISKATYTPIRRGGLQHLEAQAIAPSAGCSMLGSAFEARTTGVMLRFPASSLHVMSVVGAGHYILLGVSIGDFWPSSDVFVLDACHCSLSGLSIDDFPSALHGSDYKAFDG